MTIEDTVRASLAERLDSLDIPPGDVGRALREGGRDRRRRPLVVGLAVAASLVVVAATGVALSQRDGSERPEPAPAPGSGGWSKLPAAPLSPRANALTVWTGEEVLVIGGEVADLCPPNADCIAAAKVARDGAAYDPDSKTWRTIASPPVDLLNWTPHATVGDRIIVVLSLPVGARGGDHTFVEYDVSADAWRELPWRVGLMESLGDPLTVLDGKMFLSGDGAGLDVLDLTTGQRTELPVSPHEPSIQVGRVVPTPEGVVVMGLDSTKPNDGIEPSLLLAEVWNGETWTRLGPSEILGNWGPWHWTGERLVAPYGECLDGGETNNYGRCIPTGGALDPATAQWQPLEQAPPTQGGWSLDAVEGPLVATWGQLYDDGDQSWTTVDQPDSAPEAGVSAVFADGTLFAFGGVSWERDLRGDDLSDDAWAWTP